VLDARRLTLATDPPDGTEPTDDPLQDIAGLTLDRDLRNLLLAQRTAAHSPRLPGAAPWTGRPALAILLAIRSLQRGRPGCNRLDGGPDPTCGDTS